MHRMLFVCSLVPLVSLSAMGQDSFVAIPPERAAQYRFDFARNFFAGSEAEKVDRSRLYAVLADLERLKGTVTKSAADLEHALRLHDDVQVVFERHHAYLELRAAVDTTDTGSRAEASALEAEVRTRTAFLRQELMRIDDATLASFVAKQAHLQDYLHAIAKVRRYRPYTLSLQEEEILESTAPDNDWPYDLYTLLGTRVEPVALSGTADQKAREEAFEQSYARRAAQRDLYAFTLLRLAGTRDRLARLRHFQDAPSEVYLESYWTRSEVDALLEQIAARAPLYQRYQRLRADHVKRITGYEEVHLWDMSLRDPDLRRPRFTIDQATQAIREALAPLGVDFGRELAALLDPANGRMDIVPGEHRKRGGFSKGFIGTDSVFYSGGFAGSYNDVRVLAHESTHAVHRQLMTRNRVLPAYAEGPNYLFESFAILSELLLSDGLYAHESDPLRKQFYLEQFLDGKGTALFTVAPEVALEHAVYDGVVSGSVKGADDLDGLTKRIYSRYSIWPARHDELKGTWMDVSLMYEDPFYDVNYVYGAILALKYYEMLARDPADFSRRYSALLRNGFDAPPASLLKRFLDLDPQDPRMLGGALSVIERKVDLLEEIYRR